MMTPVCHCTCRRMTALIVRAKAAIKNSAVTFWIALRLLQYGLCFYGEDTVGLKIALTTPAALWNLIENGKKIIKITFGTYFF